MLVVGIVCAAVGVILIFVRQAQSNKLYQYQSVETSTAAQLADTAKSVGESLGKGSFVQRAELKGTAECDTPLDAEFSGTKCVHYSVSVTREYEETYTETDSEGHRVQKTRRGSETIQSNSRSVRFRLKDSTGEVTVVPDGAEFVTESSYSQYQPGETQGASIRIGSFSIGIPALGSGRRTIGYKYEERSIPVGRNLYVLGEADDKEGILIVRRPSDKKEKFIVSVKSEEELVSSAKGAVKWLGVASIVLAAAGVVMAVASFFVGG